MSRTRIKQAVRSALVPRPRPGVSASAAELALWAYAGAPSDLDPGQVAAIVMSMPDLRREMRRHEEARRASLDVYARALALGLSHEVAAGMARDVRLERSGWGRGRGRHTKKPGN